MKNLIPIVALHFNKTALTKRLLQSIIDSGYPCDLVFVYDNGSENKFSEEILASFPQFNHLKALENKGYTGGFNNSLKWVFEVGYNQAFFITNDTIYLKNAAEICHKTAIENNCDMIAPCINYLKTPEKIDSIGGFFNRENSSLNHYRENDLPVQLGKNDYIPGTTFYLTANSFNKLQGVNEDFFMFWEDADLSFRAHELGLKLGRSYEAKILHGMGQTTRKKSLYTLFYYQRNRIIFTNKYIEKRKLKVNLEIIEKEIRFYEKKWTETDDQNRIKYIEKLLNLLKNSITEVKYED